MTIRHAITISIIIHFSSFTCVFLTNSLIEITFDLNRGLSSLEMNIKERKKSKVTSDRREMAKERDLRILISSAGFFDITGFDDAEKKRSEDTHKEKDMRPVNTRELIGALCRRARMNSQNQPPVYPYLARRMGYQGKVILNIQILPSGNAGSVTIDTSSGHSILDDAALKAARGWIFFKDGEMELAKPVVIKSPPIVFILKKR